jgi:hypothetical protein
MGKIFLLALILLLSGCASLNTNITTTADNWVAFSETAQISAEKIIKVSCFHVALIKSSLGTDIYLIPSESVKILDRIEVLSGLPGPYTCQQKGEILGLWTRFYTKIVLDIIRVRMPELIPIIGAVL